MDAEQPTPYLRVDVDRLDANIARGAAWASERAVALRPHAKTHKSNEIARRQLAAGAAGLTVATVAEAEAFAAGGVDDLFVAYPLGLDDDRARRLRELAGRVRLAIGVDSVEGATSAARHLAGSGVEVVVEVDSGLHHSGCPPEQAAAVADAAAPLGVRGVFTFPGHAYGPGNAAGAAREEAQALGVARDAVQAAGHDVSVVSGGCTPSFESSDTGVLTELRPGVYVHGDAQQVELGHCALDDVALTAVGTVVHRRDGVVVLDAGAKVMGPDRPAWVSGHGRVLSEPAARITGLREHHAVVAWPDDGSLPALGSRLQLVPNHVCTAVNLSAAMTVVSGGEVVDRWPVDARGANT
ncbi:alanine racemase [Solicola sp. PLA-1-18]|uniref:alanine racemase n=1 Tax=Solicola sp. PLA-1-18 TaxID=3380532 RepID=UPI003B781782